MKKTRRSGVRDKLRLDRELVRALDPSRVTGGFVRGPVPSVDTPDCRPTAEFGPETVCAKPD